ncbi:MAG: hypothetical protein J5892_01725 [Bacilli bacterium]|nr:hypothetical protein [Bacilli bacterium]
MKVLKNKYFIISLVAISLAAVLSYVIPSLARYKNRNIYEPNIVWDGTVATRYKNGSGTSSDPYIIANGKELAFFALELQTVDYQDTYFKLANDIVINRGMFRYEDNQLKYVLDDVTYYIDPTNNNYYDTATFDNEAIGTINLLGNLSNFKGHLDGNFKTIFGYYNTTALFNSINGEVTSLYLENALVNSATSNAILANSITNSTIKNILVGGLIITPTYNGNETNHLQILSDYENMTNTKVAGIANEIINSTATNIINHANLYGSYLGSGLFNNVNTTTLKNSYNTGEIATYLSTTIGLVNGTTTIDNIYNTSSLDNLFGYFIDADITLDNAFTTNTHAMLRNSATSTLAATSIYSINLDTSLNGTQVTMNDLINKNFLTGYVPYTKIANINANNDNVWLFNGVDLPVLYFDDINTTYATLHINNNKWDSYTEIINSKSFNNNISFVITDKDNLHPTTKYYYLSNLEEVMEYSDLDNVSWTLYDSVVSIQNEGKYIIYVKLVDTNNNVNYINSDLLIIDKTGPSIDINLNNNHYSSLTSGDAFFNNSLSIPISATDSLTGVNSIEYYLSNSIIADLSTVNWSNYTSSISISNLGEYVLYVKATDKIGNISYASTPKIIYNGYVIDNFKPFGFNSGSNITNKSKISFDIRYDNGMSDNVIHYLVSNSRLPDNTAITLKTNNKVYRYVTDSNSGTYVDNLYRYPLSQFNELGKSLNSYYNETTVTSELYSFIIDFADTNILNNISNLAISMLGIKNNNVVRPAMFNQSFNISTSLLDKITHSVSTTFNTTIAVNSNSTYEIPISSVVDYKSNYDTTFNDKTIGIAIKIVDQSGNNVGNQFFKNMKFSMDNNNYYPDLGNVIHINLNQNTSINKVLTVTTNAGNSLESGTYNLVIYGYVANDGIYSNDVTNSIIIPLSINNEKTYTNYSYDVSVNNDDLIINKGDTANLAFDFTVVGIASPNIKVSLFKKANLTAYNQTYNQVNMSLYTSATLDNYQGNKYYATRNALTNNTFTYSVNTTSLDRQSYKLVFELYDGTTKVDEISKYFIVR